MTLSSAVPRVVRRSRLAAQLARYESLSPTVQTASSAAGGLGPQPGGNYSRVDERARLPAGSAERASEAILSLEMHRSAGLLVAMRNPAVTGGDTVVLGIPLGPFAVVIPCRVVWATDAGFGYATLPGHPEQGEELFLVRSGRGGGVEVQVAAYARPAGVTRLAGPIPMLLARVLTRRYLRALRRLV